MVSEKSTRALHPQRYIMSAPQLTACVDFVLENRRHADDVRKAMKAPTCVHILEGAGHHLYMEKASEFNRIVLYSLKGQFMTS